MIDPTVLARTAALLIFIGLVAWWFFEARGTMKSNTAEGAISRAMWKIVIVFVLVLLGLGVASYKAFGQSQHPPHHQALHEKFYNTWMRPDNRNISCCHDKDCAPAQSKLVNGNWQARNSDKEPWVDIPPSRIERERDSPDGQSHLCKAGVLGNVQVYCFLPANGS